MCKSTENAAVCGIDLAIAFIVKGAQSPWIHSCYVSVQSYPHFAHAHTYTHTPFKSYETHVRINVTCCHPGYYYSTTNNTCIFNSQYPNLLRPEPDYRYLYLEVLMPTSKNTNTSV